MNDREIWGELKIRLTFLKPSKASLEDFEEKPKSVQLCAFWCRFEDAPTLLAEFKGMNPGINPKKIYGQWIARETIRID